MNTSHSARSNGKAIIFKFQGFQLFEKESQMVYFPEVLTTLDCHTVMNSFSRILELMQLLDN